MGAFGDWFPSYAGQDLIDRKFYVPTPPSLPEKTTVLLIEVGKGQQNPSSHPLLLQVALGLPISIILYRQTGQSEKKD